MKKIVLIIICVSSVALGGLLRLHNGQIQQQLENGEWKCANEEVKNIMNNGDSSYVRLRYEDDGEFISFVDGTPDTERSISIEPNIPFKNGGVGVSTLEWTGHYRIDIPVFDPNDWTIPDSFIRGMCESGRICEVIGHSWEEAVHEIGWKEFEPQYRLQQRCHVCGKERKFEWKEIGKE